MGCDIHAYAERKVGDKFELIVDVTPFNWRYYGAFGFLAGVRNYSDVTPISEPRGLPDDVSRGARTQFEKWYGEAHTASWLFVSELTAFDYDQPMEDRRIRVQLSENFSTGAGTAEPGGGRMTTYRDFLGEDFFTDLSILVSHKADRVVFWFDN